MFIHTAYLFMIIIDSPAYCLSAPTLSNKVISKQVPIRISQERVPIRSRRRACVDYSLRLLRTPARVVHRLTYKAETRRLPISQRASLLRRPPRLRQKPCLRIRIDLFCEGPTLMQLLGCPPPAAYGSHR